MPDLWRKYATLQRLSCLNYAENQELTALELELNRELENLANQCREQVLLSQESHAC